MGKMSIMREEARKELRDLEGAKKRIIEIGGAIKCMNTGLRITAIFSKNRHNEQASIDLSYGFESK